MLTMNCLTLTIVFQLFETKESIYHLSRCSFSLTDTIIAHENMRRLIFYLIGA